MQVKSVQQSNPPAHNDHEWLVSAIKSGYVQGRRTLIFGILAIVITIYAVISFVEKQAEQLTFSNYFGIGIGALILVLGFFLVPVLGNRISSAMLPDMVGPKHIQHCVKLIVPLDDMNLAEIQDSALAEQGALQTSTILPNLIWTGLVALVAFAEKIQWGSPGGFFASATISVVILAVAVSSLLSVERTQANTVIIKSISQLRTARLREKVALQNRALLESLLSTPY